MRSPAPPLAPAAPARSHFERDEALAAWLKDVGLEHVRLLGADVLAPHVDSSDRAALAHVLSRHRFTDFATMESLQRNGYLLSYAPKMKLSLPPAAWRFLLTELEAVARARGELAGRLTPPDAELPRAFFERLVAFRQALPAELPPRTDADLRSASLSFSPTLPGFLYTDDRRGLSHVRGFASLVLPVVSLRAGDACSASCTCGASGCVHALAAVDALLLQLRGPLTRELEAHLQELRRPAWERALRAMERALERPEHKSSEVLVAWRLEVTPDDIFIQAYLHRVGRKGAPSRGVPVSAAQLLRQHAEHLADDDLRIARRAAQVVSRAPQSLLYALVGHPRVYLTADPERPIRVERVKVGIVAEERGGSVVLTSGIEGAPLTPSVHQRVRAARSDEALFLWDAGARLLTLLDVSEEVDGVLGVLEQYGNEFPPESHAALLERLSLAASQVPVALPRTVLGESVPPRLDFVLRLQLLSNASVRLELRVRPLPESGSFLPGEGPRDVHVRRGAKPMHARRDFEAERAAALRLIAQLGLVDAREEGEEAFVLPDPQRALALIEAVKALSPAPTLEWVGQPLRVWGKAGVDALKVTLEKKRDWFGALGGLSVAGERVELAVLLDSARRQQRFVRVNDTDYVELEDTLQRHLERLAAHVYRAPTGLELGPSAVEVLQALEDAGARVSADESWERLVERIFAAKTFQPKVPRALKATLRDYQREGFLWLMRLASWGAGGVLADDMGLGKTVQALAVLLARAKQGPALVVAPTSVGFNWVEEARRFAPSLTLHVYAESADRGALQRRLGPGDVLVLSYGLLTRDVERLSKLRFATIVFDEAQALKNALTLRAKAARALQGEFRFALSGTPLENHLGELWSVYRIVFPALFGSWDAFRDRFALPIEKRIDPTAPHALARVLAPFLLRRTKAQVARELPPRTDVKVPVVLSADEWQLYEDARLAALSDLESSRSKLREQQRRVQVLAALTRLRLLASHPKLYDRGSTVESAKLKRLVELLEELHAQGHRALVFSQFTSHLKLVREVLDARGWSYLSLDGRTPRRERERRVRAFQEGEASLFLISLKAGGFGLNLTAADDVIHLDPWWNPAVEDQASDRAHRIGQTRPVTVYRLVARGTIEEQMLALHADKRALVSGVLEGKDTAAKLSSQELLGLLSPSSPEALHERKKSTVH